MMHTPILQFLILMVVGWVTRRQQHVIEYLLEENRVLREQLPGKRIRFTDAQRRRLTVKGRALGRKRLKEFATLVTLDTIQRWYGNWLPQSMTAANGVAQVDLGLLVSSPDSSCVWLATIRNGVTPEFEAH